MLNIPEVVKALFKTDSVRKNFRVVFPDGEYRDLTNSDIVANSVKFTESVCSKTVLQFGLAEASRIEFECVGVPNIYGSTIECYCEIDATSLDAEYQTVKSDVPYPVYAIPYGVFRVQSCPRSAGVMAHRRVEAYGMNITTMQTSAYVSNLLTQNAIASDNTRVNAYYLNASSTNNALGLYERGNAITLSNMGAVIGAYNPSWEYDGHTYRLSYSAVSSYFRDALTLANGRLTCNADLTVHERVYNAMRTYGADDIVIAKAKADLQPSYRLYISGASSGQNYAFENPEDSGLISTMIFGLAFQIPYSATVSIYQDNVIIDTYTYTNAFTNVEVYNSAGIGDGGYLTLLRVGIKSTYSNETGNVTYIDSIDLEKLNDSMAEIFGAFGYVTRSGQQGIKLLSKALPIGLNKNDYSVLWWDEYDVSPIGSVKVTYYDADKSQEQTIIYQFGDGLSSYDMTDNYVFKNLMVYESDLTFSTANTLEEYIKNLLDIYFIPNITDIYFTPVDLSAIGLPYLEAGDYLEIDAGDGTTVGTYILSRTLNGEQYLTDDIQSQGGEIIGSTVRSV